VAGELADDALAQAADHLVLLQGREAHEHRDPVAEQGHEAVLPGPEGQGRGGENVAALQAGDIEPVAQEQGAGGQAQVRRGSRGGGSGFKHGHGAKIGSRG
jgi:hypothetical protein